MLIIVVIFIYIKYWEYFMLNAVGIFIYIQYWEIRYVEHRGKIYSSKILGNTLCWTLWEYLFYFTRNTGNNFMMSTVRRFIYTKYWWIHYVEQWEYLFTQNTGKYFMLSTMRIFIYTKYYEYFMLNTVGRFIYTKYFMFNTVGRFIYTKYWEIRYVEYCGSIYLLKILGNTVCWTQREDLFIQNTGKYSLLNTVGRCIYTKYWKCVHNGENWEWLIEQNVRNTLFCTMWESRFQNILANTIHNMHSFL